MPETPYRPLACALYDHLEIACLYRYRLLVELNDGNRFEADAVNTLTTPDKQEFFVVAAPDGEQRIRLDELAAITPLTPGARFARIAFGDRSLTT